MHPAAAANPAAKRKQNEKSNRAVPMNLADQDPDRIMSVPAAGASTLTILDHLRQHGDRR